MNKCSLCEHKRKTHHYYEDKNIWIADCISCNIPMLVWKEHIKDLNEDIKNKLIKFCKECFGDQIKIRWIRRKVKDHFHFHIENVKKEDLHTLKCNNILELIESKDIEPTIPKKIATDIETALLLVPPHGRLIWSGLKKGIVKTIKFKEHINENLYLICRYFCYGIIKLKEPKKITDKEFKELDSIHRITTIEKERWCRREKSWCKEPYYFYEFTFKKFSKPIPIRIKVRGPQVFIKKENIEFLNFKDMNLDSLILYHAMVYCKPDFVDLHYDIEEELSRRGYPHFRVNDLDIFYELIKNWKTYDPTKVRDKVLLDDWRICNIWMKRLVDEKKRFTSAQFKDYSLEEQIKIVRDLGRKIRKEMIRRGFHPTKELFLDLKWKLPPDMTIKDIDVTYVIGLTDKELIELWEYLSKQDYNEDIFNAGVFTGIELYKRGLWEKYKGNSRLAKEVSDEVQEYGGPGEAILEEPKGEYITLEEVLRVLPSTFKIEGQPWSIYIAGRIVNEGKVPKNHDIDFIVRQKPDPRVIKALKNLEPKWLSNRIHVVFDPLGPCVGNCIPLYQYGFFKTPREEQIKAYGAYRDLSTKNIEPITKFRLLKQKTGWEKNEFFTFDSFYKNWASKYLDIGIFVSKKYDGRAFSIQKKGDKVALITEDQQRDRSNVFPNVVKELKSIPHDFILHAEMVAYDCKNKDIKSAKLKEKLCEEIPREDFAWVTVGKVSPEQEKSIVLHVHDAIYIDKDIHNEPYEERLKLIRRLIPDKYQFIRVVESSNKITTLRELKKWVHKLRTMKGSEGAFFRTANATYPIKYTGQNRSPLLAKIKNLKSIDVMVWNRISKKTKEGKELDQYMYDCVYLIPCNLEKEYTGVVHYKNKCYAPIGRTYATNEKNNRGDIIEVLVGRIRKYTTKDGIRYTWMFPKYKERRKDKREPDTLDTVKKLSKVGPGIISELSTVIYLKMCPYYKEEWCPLRKIFRIPRAHILSEVQIEYLKFPVLCELANIYKCYYLKSYYYGLKDLIKES